MRRRTKLIVIACITAGICLAPAVASAAVLDTVLDYVFGGLLAVASGPLLIALEVVSQLLNYLLRAAAAVLNHVVSNKFLAAPITQYPIVQIGWRITRDLANMVFVLILLWVAFRFILRIGANNRQLLINTIAVALLINFSLVITGFAIDISNRIMMLFLNPIINASPGGDVSSVLLSGSGLMRAFSSPSMGIRASAQFANIGQSAFEIVFTVIMTGILLTLALLFVARLIALWRLAILAPVAWLSKAAPIGQFAGQFDSWKNSLIKWLTWGPVAAFWIFLAAMAAQTFRDANLKAFYAPFELNLQGNLLAKIPNALLNATAPLLQYIVIITFLYSAIAALKGAVAEGGLGKYIGKAVDKLTSGDFIRRPAAAAWRATGVPGGVKQRWERIKERGFKFRGKQLYGGTKAREAREAWVAGLPGLGQKTEAARRLRESRARETLKGTRESVMDVLPNDELAAIATPLTHPMPAHPTYTGPIDAEHGAAAAQELLSRTYYFEQLNLDARARAMATPGMTPARAEAEGRRAENQRREELRRIVLAYVRT